MATYYVFHPNVEVTAEVEAPDTKKARTTYLDYLARSGRISWDQRGNLRDGIKIDQMQPGEMQTSVALNYSRDAEPEEEMELPGPPPELEEYEAPPEYGPPEESPPDEIDASMLVPAPMETQARGTPMRRMYGKSPIMDLSKGVKSAPSRQGGAGPGPSQGVFGKSPIIDLSRKSRGM